MNPPDFGVRHIDIQQTNLLSEIVYDECAVNSKECKKLLELGAIFVNNERRLKDGFIFQGSTLRVHLNPRRYNCDYPWKNLVIFENSFCLVLNKPSGVPSHPSVDNMIENALTQTSLAKKIPLFVTHRLDTLTSGLIVYAKKQSFARDFNIQLLGRSTRKKYVALVETAQPLPTRLTHYMNPEPGRPKKLSDTPIDGWLSCKLILIQL